MNEKKIVAIAKKLARKYQSRKNYGDFSPESDSDVIDLLDKLEAEVTGKCVPSN